MTTRRPLIQTIGAASLASLTSVGHAQARPAKPVRMVEPSALSSAVIGRQNAAVVKKEIPKWADVVRRSNIKME